MAPKAMKAMKVNKPQKLVKKDQSKPKAKSKQQSKGKADKQDPKGKSNKQSKGNEKNDEEVLSCSVLTVN